MNKDLLVHIGLTKHTSVKNANLRPVEYGYKETGSFVRESRDDSFPFRRELSFFLSLSGDVVTRDGVSNASLFPSIRAISLPLDKVNDLVCLNLLRTNQKAQTGSGYDELARSDTAGVLGEMNKAGHIVKTDSQFNSKICYNNYYYRKN
jgi:hypothetical protein